MGPLTLMAIGSIGSMILSAIGIGAGGRQARRQERQQVSQFGQAMTLQREQLDLQRETQREQLSLNKLNALESRRQDAKTWKWKEEDRNYRRSQDFVDNFSTMLNQDVGLRNNLLRVWGR